MKASKIIILGVFPLFLVGCQLNKKTSDKSSEDMEITDIQQKMIEGKRWKLKELKGKKMNFKENQEGEIYFTLKSSENSINGFAGCNNFFGEYELKGNNKIKVSNIGMTLMACPDLDIDETDFINTLEAIDTYQINNETLQIKDNRGKVLAVFEAVYF